jgi:putative spermidine/putrescine transport system permease protein
MTISEVAVSDPGASAPGSETTSSKRKSFRKLLRRLESTFAVTPFVVFSFAGLGVPALAVIYQAFHGNTGGWTLSNMRLILSGSSNPTTHGIFLIGFENSIKLGLLSSLIPGVVGVFVAYAIQTSKSNLLRRLTSTASGVLANFGGINLTFMFVATLGSVGILTAWLHAIGISLTSIGFNLYTFSGVVVVYMYFQLPLMVLVITPALSGLRQSWREAAENMGASSFRYWIHVGIPVLLPSILGGMLLLFGSAFAAYATAATLTLGLIALSPIQIGNFLNGNVIAGETHVGYAIAFGMLVILAFIMLLYSLVRKRASKWLR